MSIVNLSQSEFQASVDLIDMYSDFIFVDAEKKCGFEIEDECNGKTNPLYSNLLAAAYQRIDHNKVLPWSASRLTSDAAICELRKRRGGNLSGHHMSLVGPGSIGFKVAHALVDEGAYVHIYDRQGSRGQCLISAINYTKSRFTIAAAIFTSSLDIAFASSECVILSASSRKYVTVRQLQLLPPGNTLVLDIGKDSLTLNSLEYIRANPSINYMRLDIGSQLMRTINSHLFRDEFECGTPQFVVRDSSGSGYVSGGYTGKAGDIVVDDANQPTFQLGYINTNGEFVSEFKIINEIT